MVIDTPSKLKIGQRVTTVRSPNFTHNSSYLNVEGIVRAINGNRISIFSEKGKRAGENIDFDLVPGGFYFDLEVPDWD